MREGLETIDLAWNPCGAGSEVVYPTDVWSWFATRSPYQRLDTCEAPRDMRLCTWYDRHIFHIFSMYLRENPETFALFFVRHSGVNGFEGWHQEEVLRKIETFLKQVLRRAIVNMHRISEHKEELAGFWCNAAHQSPNLNFRVQCDEVSILASCVYSADVEVVCLNLRLGCLSCIGCCQVFSKVLIVRLKW